MIAIIDYGMGNLRSVAKAFEACGARSKVTSRPRDVERAEKIVLPGVGAFTQAMKELKRRKLAEPIIGKIRAGTPYVGMCLGLQLLFSWSEEGKRVRGLGIIAGPVRRFRVRLKVPHMGWNEVVFAKRGCPILRGLKSGERFYFVHSYYGVPEDPSWVLARTRYGIDFCSAVWKENIFAVQFHPEKSQETGLKLIKNFVEHSG